MSTLRRHGIPDELSSSIVAKFPRILTLKPDRNLAPKLDFLRSHGFSGPEIAGILLHNPHVFLRSLDRFIAPAVLRLKSTFSSNDDVLKIITFNRWLIVPWYMTNIKLLRDRGVSRAMIVKLFFFHSRSLWCPPEDFLHTVDFVIEKLNLRPTATTFLIALRALYGVSRPATQSKVELYKELGWAEEEVLGMFRLQPTIIRLSDGVVRRKVGYFRDTLGWGPEFLCKYPEIMTMSVEKRIAPRCAVLDLLMTRGLLRRTTRPVRKLKLSNERFAEELVKKHEEAAPDVARAYAGKVEFSGWSWLKEDAENQPFKALSSIGRGAGK